MSRSMRHTPVIGNCSAPSEKLDKRQWNRVFRWRAEHGLQLEDGVLPINIRKETEVWSGGKDGKHRFDPKRYPRSMRK